MAELAVTRQAFAKRGKRLEYLTIAWNILEGMVAVISGAVAGSVSLVGFGIDSFVEVTSASTLLWRMSVTPTTKGGSRTRDSVSRLSAFASSLSRCTLDTNPRPTL